MLGAATLVDIGMWCQVSSDDRIQVDGKRGIREVSGGRASGRRFSNQNSLAHCG